MEKVNDLMERFKNPALWLTLIAAFFWLSVRVNKIDEVEKGRKSDLQMLIKHANELDDIRLRLLTVEKNQIIEAQKKEIEYLKRLHEIEMRLK